MNEEGRKKREWVKTAAIIFLSVMLVLTFFSNTIMNYSLPEVATQYVQSGTITAKIRGSGVVESGDPYQVEIKESRKVASVVVRVGDTVEKGDVLMYLEDEESEELKAARKALEDARDVYNTALLSADLTATDIREANAGVSAETYRQQLTNAQNAVTGAENAIKAAQSEVDAAQAKVNELEQWQEALNVQISITPVSGIDVSELTEKLEAAKAARDNAVLEEKNAETALNDKRVEASNLQGQIDTLQVQVDALQAEVDAMNPAADGYEDKKSELDAKKEDLDNLKTNFEVANNDIPGLEAAYAAAKDATGKKEAEVSAWQEKITSEGIRANLNNQLNATKVEVFHAKNTLEEKKAALENAEKLLDERKENLADLVAKFGRVAGLEDAQKAIDEAQKLVDELTAKSIDATITAPISGTITTLNVTAGETASAAAPVAVMQPAGKGYTLSFTVTNEQARRLSVGDQADLSNAWKYDDVTVTLASIKPDTSDPGQKKLLTFDVTGSVTAGQTLNLSVGQRSSNYDLIVPNSAIREDNNGKFILIVESKPGPLNTRYIATRVDVEVLASDDTQSAISAALYGYEFVITTSTKPVEAGKQVRLAD